MEPSLGPTVLGGSEDVTEDDSNPDRNRSQSVTFTSGLSKEELDKPKLQRIPTPYYEHLQQTGAAGAAGDSEGGGGKGSAGSKEAVPSNSEPPAQTEPLSESPRGDSDDLGNLRQVGPPARPAPSTARRIQREFSMSRDD